jgi:glycosyltransferase involved in cell wall biosynthesis
MRILVLAPHPFYIERGTPIDVDILLRGLSQRGEEVDVLSYHVGADRAYPKVTIHRIQPLSWITHVPPGISLRKLICDGLFLREAWRLIRRNRYDLIHAGEEAVFAALLFNRLYGVPYIYDMDSSIAQQSVEKFRALRCIAPLLNWLEGTAIRGSAAVAPVCNALADLAHERGARLVETLHDISQLSEHDFEPRADLRRRLGISGTLVMYVGNLEPYQGIDLLLESTAVAAGYVDDFAVVIAGGDDKAIASYERKAKALGVEDRTHFIGAWPLTRIGELISEADILTAPRIRGINTPMKVFPYLHSGKPVLVTDLITHSQILDDSVAFLAPADPEGFGRAMARLVADPELRARLGAAGRAFVQHGHTYEAYSKRLNRLYDSVARRIGSASGHESESKSPAKCATPWSQRAS